MGIPRPRWCGVTSMPSTWTGSPPSTPAGDPVLRRLRPGALRRDRDPGAVPDPADPDLLTRPVCGVLTSIGDDGQPQSSVVWVDHAAWLGHDPALPAHHRRGARRDRLPP